MSDQEDSMSDSEAESKSLNLAGFLFGNIDQDGKLEENFLDENSKKKLGGLSAMLGGLEKIISDEVKTAKVENPEEIIEKAQDAEDFSTIKEALTDDSSDSDNEEPSKEIKEEPKEEVDIKKEPVAEDEEKKLMPPPPPSVSKPQGPVKKPLASMLPAKYKDIDIHELFPEFRENDVLRFSRLFPIKSSHKPRIWKNVKRRFKTEETEENVDVSPPKITKNGEWLMYVAPPPTDPEAYVQDQAIRFHRPFQAKKTETESGHEKKAEESKRPQSTDWRYGPAQYWYDMLGVPDKCKDFDYGLKDAEKLTEEVKDGAKERQIPDDAFLMVTQTNWEDDVIWNGDDIRHKVLQKLNSKSNAAGWVPSSFNRTAGSMTGKLTGIKPQTMHLKKPLNDEEFYSIFPVENEELVYGRWEDEVIWDHEKMNVKLEPKMVTIDPNDDNIILGIPEDIDPATLPQEGPIKKVKIIQKHVKKSRMMLNRSGIINVIEEESPPPPPKIIDKDPYNMSNDEFYTIKTHDSAIKVSSSEILQHATPVVELRAPFVPTYLGEAKLRLFHRHPLKRFSHGVLADIHHFHGVSSLDQHMKKRGKEREKEREAAGGGEIFFMRTPEDVSGRDGEIILMEYTEEYPPLLSLIGMCSKIKNYFKRKPGSNSNEEYDKKKFEYGALNLAHTSPFLGQMHPGETIQAFENNMFRAPIYRHKVATSDFLVIRTRNEYSIREINASYTVGQECPLYEVPGPNSKKANNFTRDFLQVFIYRLFWSSKDNPRRIKMDVIKKAFPAHSESSIRKRLKPCAEFHRTGHDSNWWVIKHNFRLPTEDEIRSMVSPEQCCAYFSMIAAEQRLKDAGYGEKSLIAAPEDDDEETSMKLDVEVQVAPWNTTRAYILAMKGKCLLQLTGPADPTGPAGEGFSYVRIPNKPTNKEDQEQQPKRTVTGTDADLRKLPLKEARAILRQNGVPEEEIKRLSRWEVIDVVRTLSTEKVKAGEDGEHKFSRGNRFSIAEHQERYREDCQRIFDTQNKVLASDEILSSDENYSSDEDDDADVDLDEMGKSLETLLSNKKSSSQILREREEKERKNLQKMIHEGSKQETKQDDKQEEDDGPPKMLRITRTFRNANGKEYVRTEIVRKPIVVQTYVRIRQTKDAEFIKQFATLDEAAKEEMKKEKRRIQEQLRRIKRNQEKERQRQMEQIAKHEAKLAKLAAKDPMKVKCGACGAFGHMKTNRACPKFNPNDPEMLQSSVNVALTERDEEELEKNLVDIELAEGEELVNVDGTKVTLSSKVLKHAEEMRRRSMILKVPKNSLKNSSKRRRAGTVEHCDYLTNKNYKNVKRRRADPMVELGTFLDKVLNELFKMNEATQFIQPVNTKKVVDYLDKIKNPMDLQTIKENVSQKQYHCRQDFLIHMKQIVENSAIYNGENDVLTNHAKMLYEKVIFMFSKDEEDLIRLEKLINPLLDDNDQVGFSFILETVLDKHIIPRKESGPFQQPVNRKQMKHYYDLIKDPMDLETMRKKIAHHEYHHRSEFLADMKLIYNNSKQFNGEHSEFTLKAKFLLSIADEKLYSDPNMNATLAEFEEKIKKVQERVLEQAEVDSIGTSLGELDESSRTSMLEQPQPKKSKREKKKGRPSRKAKMNKNYSNLEDDLQYSSDDHFEDFEDEEDEDDEDWQEVDNTGFTVTVDPNAEFLQGVQIDAPNVVISNPVQEEEQVDENYDPTSFLHESFMPKQPEVVTDITAAVNEAIAGQSIDVINDDLDISDDSEDEQQQPPQQPQQPVQPPPPSEEATNADDDGIWF